MSNSSELHRLSGKALNDFNFFDGKLIIVGAGGWLGSATLDLLNKEISNLSKCVYCFGSKNRDIILMDGSLVKQKPLSEIENLPVGENYKMINFSFLTKDKLSKKNFNNYIDINRSIGRTLINEARRLKIKNVATISSGAVYGENQTLVSDLQSDTYGVLKLEEESLFTELVKDKMCVVIPRLFNVSGPYIKNFNSYMLSSIIWQAISSHEIRINSSHKVIRSFVAISELISLILGIFSQEYEGRLFLFDTAGDQELEIEDLALEVKNILSSSSVIVRPKLDDRLSQDRYIGSRSKYKHLLSEFNITNLSISNQILCTYEYMKTFKEGK